MIEYRSNKLKILHDKAWNECQCELDAIITSPQQQQPRMLPRSTEMEIVTHSSFTQTNNNNIGRAIANAKFFP
ncbi:hypothetical protein DERP_012703 [Dermatophagoides pteronyssinus]|uniref:Uncharacterized protein n=1 Tax=Dermatophagoides pteronyssinus TaxID=6956 RepID=A0ABQ8IYP8_DERPT|nr:hypothetical protein DERP_012703 [Dermatophagoides pteronyssinus]